jgi:hypothetical protein
LECLKKKDDSEDLGVDGRTILNWILGNRVGGCGLDSSGTGQGPMAGSCEHVNKPFGSIKGGEFLNLLNVLLASQEGLCSTELIR